MQPVRDSAAVLDSPKLYNAFRSHLLEQLPENVIANLRAVSTSAKVLVDIETGDVWRERASKYLLKSSLPQLADGYPVYKRLHEQIAAAAYMRSGKLAWSRNTRLEQSELWPGTFQWSPGDPKDGLSHHLLQGNRVWATDLDKQRPHRLDKGQAAALKSPVLKWQGWVQGCPMAVAADGTKKEADEEHLVVLNEQTGETMSRTVLRLATEVHKYAKPDQQEGLKAVCETEPNTYQAMDLLTGQLGPTFEPLPKAFTCFDEKVIWMRCHPDMPERTMAVWKSTGGVRIASYDTDSGALVGVCHRPELLAEGERWMSGVVVPEDRSMVLAFEQKPDAGNTPNNRTWPKALVFKLSTWWDCSVQESQILKAQSYKQRALETFKIELQGSHLAFDCLETKKPQSEDSLWESSSRQRAFHVLNLDTLQVIYSRVESYNCFDPIWSSSGNAFWMPDSYQVFKPDAMSYRHMTYPSDSKHYSPWRNPFCRNAVDVSPDGKMLVTIRHTRFRMHIEHFDLAAGLCHVSGALPVNSVPVTGLTRYILPILDLPGGQTRLEQLNIAWYPHLKVFYGYAFYDGLDQSLYIVDAKQHCNLYTWTLYTEYACPSATMKWSPDGFRFALSPKSLRPGTTKMHTFILRCYDLHKMRSDNAEQGQSSTWWDSVRGYRLL